MHLHSSTPVWRIALALLSGLLPALAAPPLQARPPLPFEAPHQHIGVATCAGSNCHGSQRPFDDSAVLQNEYFLWQREDAHSNAYKLLLTANGKRIAQNLGIKDAASAAECLTCHTDYVDSSLRGRRYAMSEGVGCEACHGGAQQWLGPHVSGNTHAQNIEQGLYPLENPLARARLCLNCHMGTKDKPIDHRIMGAGHPPLEFELDTFTNIQPAHFRVDSDYRQRKPAYATGAQTWVIGQLVAAETFLDGLGSPRLSQRGLFPELVFFDCNACHHAPQNRRWNPGVADALGPGEVRLADAYLTMTGVILGILQPQAGARWNAALAQLHRASQQSVSQIRDAAQKLKDIVQAELVPLSQQSIDKAQATALLQRLAQLGIDGKAGDYTTAKQIYYGADALVASLRLNHGVNGQPFEKPLDDLFSAVDAVQNYNPDALRSAAQKLRTVAQTLR